MAGIRATRENIDDRFPVLGFAVNTGTMPIFEVAMATDPELLKPEHAPRRTKHSFFASGLQRAERGQAVYLVPSEALNNFVGQSRLYFGLAVMPATDRARATVVNMPSQGNLYVSLSGLTGRSLRRLTAIPSPRRAQNGYGAPAPALNWAADSVLTPGMQPIVTPANGTAVKTNGNGAIRTATAPASTGAVVGATPANAGNGAPAAAAALDYDDGFDPNLWSSALVNNTATITPIYKPADAESAMTLMREWQERGQRWSAGVEDTAIFPHSAICRLYVTKGGKTYVATGSYVSADRILTAAHVLKDADSVRVVPGQNGAQKPFGEFTVGKSNVHMHPRYAKDGEDYDLGVLTVKTGPPHGIYFWPLEELNQSIPETITVCGYAAETVDGNKQHLDGDHVRELNASGGAMLYNLRTEGGTSGSPVFYITVYEDDVRRQSVQEIRLIGVHIAMGDDITNKGCRLTDDKINWIFNVGTEATAKSLDASAAEHLANEDAAYGIEGPIPDAASTPSSTSQAYAYSLVSAEYPGAARFEPAHSGNFRATPSGKSRAIKRIVIHITDGGANVAGPISWFRNPSAKVSAHYIIGQDGEVVQMVNHNDVAWHAGSANGDSIGIEHVANTRGLQPTEQQYCASAALVSWLCDQYGIAKNRDHILGHAEADAKTNHKACPNAVWDWDYFMRLVETGSCEPKPVATVESMSVRRALVLPLENSEYPAARFEPAASGNYRATPAGKTRVIKRIIIHTNDGGTRLDGTVSWFKDPKAKVSAHYIVGRDGEVVQMVRHNDIAWHAKEANDDSIGIEHIANSEKKRALAPTKEEYQASAALVSWLCDQYDIPKDREHIIGHSEAGGSNTHGDPGEIWDWDHYMQLVLGGSSQPYTAPQGFSGARQLGIEESPSPFPDTTLTRISDSRGSVSWTLDQLRGMKQPATARMVVSPVLDAQSIRLDDWPSLTHGDAKAFASFVVDWQYDGQALGNIRIVNTAAEAPAGISLVVTGTIQALDEATPGSQPEPCGIGIEMRYAFAETSVDSTITPHIARTVLQLFGNGTYNRSSRWE